jgi:beta-mannanase
MNLENLIATFRAAHPEWETQKGAYYQCDLASDAFIGFLEKLNLRQALKAEPYSFYVNALGFDAKSVKSNPDPELYVLGNNESGLPKASWRYIVETEYYFIDWTARQYTSRVPYPYLIPKTEPYYGA